MDGGSASRFKVMEEIYKEKSTHYHGPAAAKFEGT